MRRLLAFLPMLLAMPFAWRMELRGRTEEAQRSRGALEEATDQLGAELRRRVDRIRALQVHLAGALEGPIPTEAEWQAQVRRAGAEQVRGLRFIHVVQRIAAKDLPAYDRALRARSPGARVWDIQGGHEGALTRREWYYPVRFCYPPRPDALGMDQAGRLESWSDIYLPAQQEGRPRLGGPIHTVFFPGRVAVLLASPMGDGQAVGPEAIAFVTMVVDLPTLTEGLGPGLGWTLHDGAIAHPSTLLAQGGGSLGALRAQRDLPLWNRVWTLRTGADPLTSTAPAQHGRFGMGALLLGAALVTTWLWMRLGGR